MRLLRKLSFLLIILLTLLISHNFANAQDGYGDEEIWIDGNVYKNVETEFQQIEPTSGTAYDSDIPYIYDENEYPTEDSFPNLDGQTIIPTIVCDDPSGTNCYSIGIPGTAIGEPVLVNILVNQIYGRRLIMMGRFIMRRLIIWILKKITIRHSTIQ